MRGFLVQLLITDGAQQQIPQEAVGVGAVQHTCPSGHHRAYVFTEAVVAPSVLCTA